MEKAEPKTHRQEAFLYACSRALERAAYYGIRALIIIYMVSETIDMDRSEALAIYGWFTMLMIFSQVLGGVIGDLIIGNRKAIIFGAVIQTVGAFVLCTPNDAGLYSGLALVILGGGLYTPNVIANFGKLYLDRVKLLDSAFALDYLAINIGAFLGIMLTTYYGEEHGWNTGFSIAGFLMLASVVPIISSRDRFSEKPSSGDFSTGRRIVSILFPVLLVALFWMVYEMTSVIFFNVQQELTETLKSDLPASLLSSLQFVIQLPILVGVFFLWTYLYSNQMFKLMLGFIFGATAYGVLWYLPEVPTEQHYSMYLTSLVLLGLSEVYIAPMIGSVVTKYSNPKYLAIMFSLVFIPSRMFSVALGMLNEGFLNDPSQALTIGLLIMVVVSGGLALFYFASRKKTASL